MRAFATWTALLTTLSAATLPAWAGEDLADKNVRSYRLSASEAKIDGALRAARRGAAATSGPAMNAIASLRDAAGRYNITVKFDHELSEEELASYERGGVQFRRLPSGRIAGAAGIYAAWASDEALNMLAGDSAVESIEGGRPTHVRTPLDVSRVEIQADVRHATRTWSHLEGNRGEGQTIGLVDTGIDIFHPAFFSVKRIAAYNWIDVNGDGEFTPGMDAVDMNRNGSADAGESLSFFERIADAGANLNVYDVDSDWLYHDENGDGERNFGPADGFTEADDCYGERLFYVADTNGDDRLSVGEKLHVLGKSKVRKVRFGDHEYVRGVDLINTPIDQNGHGTAVCGILVGDAAGFDRRFCGIAPDAELVVVDRYSFDADDDQDVSDNYVEMLLWMEEQGAKVMLWEMGGWTGKAMDGSSHLESLISNRQLIGSSVQVVPNGNLGGMGRHAEATIPANGVADRTFSLPGNINPSVLWTTVLTNQGKPHISMALEVRNGTGGFGLVLPGGNEINGHIVFAEYSSSSNETHRMDLTIFKLDGTPVSTADWTIRIRNFENTEETFHFFVDDDQTTWGNGAFWTQDVDASTVAWPATATACVSVASYSTVAGDYPGDIPGVLSPFSGRGPRIDGAFVHAVAAPGDYNDVWTAQTQAINPAGAHGGLRPFGGTSAAGPHVAATAALLFEAYRGVGAMDVRDALLNSAAQDGFTGAPLNDDWGYGKLRADDAYEYLAAQRCNLITPALNESNIADGATEIDPDQFVNLAWSTDANASLYDLRFGATNPPNIFVSGLFNASDFDIPSGQLAPNTTYYWQVVGSNACGHVAYSEVFSFTTGAGYVPQPDIEVYQQVLVNNEFVRTQIPTGGLWDFPDVMLGEQDGVIFAIYNEGDAPLDLTGTPKVQLSGPGVADYNVNYIPVEDSIAPDNWAPFAVTFKPVFEGTRVVTVRIYTNDPDEAQYTLTLFGNGVAADDGEPNEPAFEDDDGDGVPNDIDVCPGEDDNLDSDGDGVADCLDLCPADPAKTDPGACGCGVADEDVDNDGIADCDDDQIGDPNDGDAPEPNDVADPDPNDGVVPEPNDVFAPEPNDGLAPEPNDIETPEPNRPVLDDPNAGLGDEPNEPRFEEPNDVDGNDPNDDGELDPNDLDDIIAPISPGGMCGFGAGFAMMFGFLGYGGCSVRRLKSKSA